MFDLITGNATHTPRHQSTPILVSTTAHIVVVALVVVIPLFFVTHQLPAPPVMMAFVAPPPAPPPPPPPPAAAREPAKRPPAARTDTPAPRQLVAPVEAAPEVTPEPAGEDDAGVPDGVEGGVPGGVVGGVVGGLPEAPPPPPPLPPPPPAPVRSGPVRVGGNIKAPTLIHRVEPIYPPMAVNAHLQGIVILEAVVDEAGLVKDVKVLRSVNPLLDYEALRAVRQWRYTPVVLNGTPVPFVLTVSLSFALQTAG